MWERGQQARATPPRLFQDVPTSWRVYYGRPFPGAVLGCENHGARRWHPSGFYEALRAGSGRLSKMSITHHLPRRPSQEHGRTGRVAATSQAGPRAGRMPRGVTPGAHRAVAGGAALADTRAAQGRSRDEALRAPLQQVPRHPCRRALECRSDRVARGQIRGSWIERLAQEGRPCREVRLSLPSPRFSKRSSMVVSMRCWRPPSTNCRPLSFTTRGVSHRRISPPQATTRARSA